MKSLILFTLLVGTAVSVPLGLSGLVGGLKSKVQHVASEVTNEVAGKVSHVVEAGHEVVGDVAGKVTGKVSHVVEAGHEVVGDVAGEVTGKVSHVVEAGHEVVGDVAGEVTGKVSHVVEAGHEVVGDVAGKVTGKVSHVVEVAKEVGHEVASEVGGKVTHTVEGVKLVAGAVVQKVKGVVNKDADGVVTSDAGLDLNTVSNGNEDCNKNIGLTQDGTNLNVGTDGESDKTVQVDTGSKTELKPEVKTGGTKTPKVKADKKGVDAKIDAKTTGIDVKTVTGNEPKLDIKTSDKTPKVKANKKGVDVKIDTVTGKEITTTKKDKPSKTNKKSKSKIELKDAASINNNGIKIDTGKVDPKPTVNIGNDDGKKLNIDAGNDVKIGAKTGDENTGLDAVTGVEVSKNTEGCTICSDNQGDIDVGGAKKLALGLGLQAEKTVEGGAKKALEVSGGLDLFG